MLYAHSVRVFPKSAFLEMNKGMLEFLITKIESTYENKEHIEIMGTIAKIAAIFWIDIIQFHPFVDGNKRTATEIMLLFLKKNNYMLETPIAGKVYMSLKITSLTLGSFQNTKF